MSKHTSVIALITRSIICNVDMAERKDKESTIQYLNYLADKYKLFSDYIPANCGIRIGKLPQLQLKLKQLSLIDLRDLLYELVPLTTELDYLKLIISYVEQDLFLLANDTKYGFELLEMNQQLKNENEKLMSEINILQQLKLENKKMMSELENIRNIVA
jgi:hypothetical protein